MLNMPSNTSLEKLGNKVGFNMPGGITNCNLSNSSNKSSGKPWGNGEIFGSFKANGIPTPGMGGPLGTVGDGKETSVGLHGDINYLYIGLFRFTRK